MAALAASALAQSQFGQFGSHVKSALNGNQSARSQRARDMMYPPNAMATPKAVRTLLVGIKPGTPISAFTNALPQGAAVLREIPRLNLVSIIFSSEAAAKGAMAKVKAMPMVRYVQRDGVQKIDAFPNDPMYKSQWSHRRTAATLAWGITTGASTTIAVVDTGIDLAHPEFAGRIVNPMSFTTPTVADVQGHGTHTSGIAAAAGNNGIGVAGVSWRSNIMPVKGLYDDGTGSDSDLLAALTAAADAGADVISYSIGGYADGASDFPQAWIDCVDYMHSKGCVFVGSAGNNSINVDTVREVYGVWRIPGSYSEVFDVASSNSRNQRSGFSNYGLMVDVTAPGEDILSTLPDGYGIESGTSMACPYVSGVSALIKSVGGLTMPPADVQTAITSTASALPTGCAHGLLNAYLAVNAVRITDFDLTPSSVNIVYGSLHSGSASDLDTIDDVAFSVQATNIPNYGPTIMYDSTYNIGDTSNIYSITFQHIAKADQYTNCTINLWDPVKLKWVTFSSKLLGTTTSTMSFHMYATDIAKYVDSFGVLKARFTGVTRLRRFGGPPAGLPIVDADAQGLKFVLK
ncbi:MAG: S8 family serine peptidase [Fimbriimonadaceae bacterium]|nr:S8 family serine peptidase [Fimbriimonadaceae bacterium]